MPDLGPHAVFILAAYGVTLVTVAALIGFIVADDRRQRFILAELERRGMTRRSAKPKTGKAVAKPKTGKPQAKAKTMKSGAAKKSKS